MTAVARYRLALLLRSQRWIAPAVLVGFVVATSVAGRSQVGDAYGFVAAGLVPGCAWLVRLVATAEPLQSRVCTIAAVGRWRDQAGVIVASLVAGLTSALAVTAVIAVLAATGGLPAARLAGAPAATAVEQAAAAGSGLLAAITCAATGLGIGLLVAPPVVQRLAPSTCAAGSLCVLALASHASPAYAALGANGQLPPGAGVAGTLLALVASAVLLLLAAAVSVAGALWREAT